MKRADILSRIIELVRQKRVNGKLDLLSDDYPDYKIERLLFISGGELYYCCKATNGICITCPERKIRKYRLAAILYEIGDEKDRSDVRNDVLLSDYAYLNNKLGIVEKTLNEIRERKLLTNKTK
jgi:hypothetical protein